MIRRVIPLIWQLGVLAGCGLRPAPSPPAPVMAALNCAEQVVERYGFLDREGNWFPSHPQGTEPTGFIAQRGDSDSRESIHVRVLSHSSTGAVKLYARGSGHWANAGRPSQLASSTVEYVVRQVQAECGGVARAT